MWRSVLCILGLMVFTQSGIAQQYAFRVSFTNKDGTSDLSNPQSFLSQRAIDRRAVMGIVIDSTDLPVSPDYVDSVLTLTTGKAHMRSRWYNYFVVLLTDSSKILTLQGKPYIKEIELVGYYPGGLHKPSKNSGKFDSEKIVGSRSVMKTTGSAGYYGSSYGQSAMVNGDYLHDLGRMGQGKLIAVLDEGFKYTNTGPAFDSMNNDGRLKDVYNFEKANTDVYSQFSHGTRSLSTMAGYIPGVYVGAAPKADYALYVTEVSGSEQPLEMDHLVGATERADSLGADIITISLGYDIFNLPVYYPLTYSDIDGKTTLAARTANMATTKGILFVASAGNEGGGSWNYILTPGDADSAITVGSVDKNKVPAGNSGYGPNSAGRVKPDVCMQGEPASVIEGTGQSFSTLGTSFATPQLAGWAACLMQASGVHTPYQIRTAITQSAHVYNTPGVQLGYGVPNFHYALNLLNVIETPKLPTRNEWMTAGPNPFTQELKLRVYRERKGDLDVTITDMSGRVVHTYHSTVYQGTQSVNIDLAYLPAGVYMLNAVADEDRMVVKAVKR